MKQIITFDGQDSYFNQYEGIIQTHINSTFNSAGMQYGWEGLPKGVGINKDLLEFACSQYAKIILTVEGYNQDFVIDAWDWMNLTKKHNSFYLKKTLNKTIILCVIQLSETNSVKTQNVLKEYVQTKIN